MTHLEYHAIDTENEVLHDRLKTVLAAATKLCDTVTEYTRQGVSRSILMNTVRDTREVIQRGGASYNPKPRTAKADRA